MKKLIIATICLVFYPASEVFSQEEKQQKATDSIKKNIKIVESDTKEEKNRNVMLNAANNTGPRDVNIGLPSTVGGITIQENDLPVVYYFWPELPNRTWRQSKSLEKTGLLKIGEAAITTGDLGFAVNSYTKLATDKLEIVGNLSGSYAVFRYKEGGKVEEYNDFKIGRDWYIVNDGTLKFKDIMTGETKFADMGGSDAASTSHTFDILGNYDLANDWKFNFSTRFRYAEASQLIAFYLEFSRQVRQIISLISQQETRMLET
ncbi:hypothetical protein [Flavobacterium sp. LM4]|uniref:hypothetical protein n=1 Tax=Flavobacterium sp. LM4 TaxID=1938609 RepID=UPI000991D110|nr:hypothetical protein [Flavobacterium sp. LM4]OOV17607.1 hypothetical protein BXU10_16160 [Flavobacterium sp. LM4]